MITYISELDVGGRCESAVYNGENTAVFDPLVSACTNERLT